MKAEIQRSIACLALSLAIGCDAPNSLFDPATHGRSASAATYPSLAGTYVGHAVGRARTSAGPTYSVTCAVRIEVATQSGAQFSGHFTVEAGDDCRAESGSVSGTIETGGAVHLVADAPGGGANVFEDAAARTGCRLVSTSGTFDGTTSGGVLAATGSGSYQCPLWGRVNVDVSLSVTRS